MIQKPNINNAPSRSFRRWAAMIALLLGAWYAGNSIYEHFTPSKRHGFDYDDWTPRAHQIENYGRGLVAEALKNDGYVSLAENRDIEKKIFIAIYDPNFGRPYNAERVHEITKLSPRLTTC